MRAVLCTEFLGLDAITLGEAPTPEIAADEVLIRVEAASVSYMDVLMTSGRYQMKPELPYSPGTEACGEVVAVGAEVRNFSVGDRVAHCGWNGAFAEYMAAKATRCVAAPAHVDAAEAATLLHNYATAYYALVARAPVKAGETVFITGATGGVGLACVDLAKKLGARVIAGVGSDDKVQFARDYGADETLNYATEDLRARIKEMTDGAGVDVCVENVGGEIFLTMARLMNWEGRLIPMGFAGGDIPSLPMNLPLVKNYSVVGLFMGAWMEKRPDEAQAANQQLMDWLAAGELRPKIDRILPLEEAREGMRLVKDREVLGRVVIRVA